MNHVKCFNMITKSIIVLLSQILFLYFRTLNIKAVTEKHTIKAIVTGWGIGITWMVSTSIGVNAMLNFELLPIVCHLIGGSIGTYLAMKKK